MQITETALAGMQRAESTVNRAARRIALAEAPSGDQVDLSAEMVALMKARNDFSASAKAAQTADEMSGALLSILA